jgi:bifunctional DNA-binding transcriptional regulator/antitoxin component of YhaV-PrlF toxin-antitoxin module
LQRIGNDAATNDNLAVLIKFQVGRKKAQKAQKESSLAAFAFFGGNNDGGKSARQISGLNWGRTKANNPATKKHLPGEFMLANRNQKLEILTMTSTITTKGQTVVPKELRRQFELDSGAVLDWRAEGDSMRVVKLAHSAKGGFVQALRRLGRVPAAPRDRRLVEDA